MAVGDAHVFSGFLTPVLFFPKPPTTFLTCFFRGEKRKYAVNKVRLNRGSKSQPPGHECDTLATEPPWRASLIKATDHIVHAFPGFYQFDSHETSIGSNPGRLDYESNAVSQNHAGPLIT